MTTSSSPKRILIRTLPLANGNYGGILQAYALQRTLRDMGHSVSTDVSSKPTALGSVYRAAIPVKRAALKRPLLARELDDLINDRLLRFVSDHIQTVRLFGATARARASVIRDFDLFVTGSDQVWRPNYGSVASYMFDFLGSGRLSRPRISYAASFGVNESSEFDPAMRTSTAELAARFAAISVREADGVRVAEELWGVRAAQHVDPTLLISRDDYSQLADAAPPVAPPPYLATYVLDADPKLERAISNASSVTQLPAIPLNRPKPPSVAQYIQAPENYSKISIETWLRGIRDAEFLITDSFHGCVFAVMFEVPFAVVPNSSRGRSRFDSLLGMFGLEDRILDLDSEMVAQLSKLATSQIDWASVRTIIARERVRSNDYLLENC
ncbi:polysaccharide pyruvyl transferase family protein [Microbacterium sp. NPDC056569]|uniref:polysaccharide pyruvyl transferase family protein n=1 Tax=Microbacterium sp. NPDC056569 TaxID=3345867 RepID=UPI00366D3E12